MKMVKEVTPFGWYHIGEKYDVSSHHPDCSLTKVHICLWINLSSYTYLVYTLPLRTTKSFRIEVYTIKSLNAILHN